MTIQVNGDPLDCPEKVVTVTDLLDFYKLDGKMVIVEYNQTIIQRDQYSDIHLQKGDQIELVHFVGGG
ncbi:sulfur carrier protein ThiS [Halobacillus shinanisalinarum]|uniref:Sulfur carrier protein ThiS n=1 Tax=Halobacillus shinanisalinarum TaxID=2932258 RepID=A0ABY4GV83_9BACI|nr:sulfur carrier protein ThiS [Halobacillus shinanisalinarum]UOQ91625.1 sulfur carrier protein ThiS [Halobacillus shinanisalinarum]